MNELEINGKTYPIKFNHRFYDRIVEEYARKNKNSNVDGFNNLIEGLISQDPDAVINAYRCAYQSKSLPSVNAVSDALEESGVFDSADVFNNVYKEIKANGFLAMKIHHLLYLLKDAWKNSEVALKVVRQKTNKGDQKNLREAELGVEVAKQNYELTKKQLQELSK